MRSCKMTYTKYTNENGFTFILKQNNDESITWIPTDPANSDYQAYLNKDNPDWNKPTL